MSKYSKLKNIVIQKKLDANIKKLTSLSQYDSEEIITEVNNLVRYVDDDTYSSEDRTNAEEVLTKIENILSDFKKIEDKKIADKKKLDKELKIAEEKRLKEEKLLNVEVVPETIISDSEFKNLKSAFGIHQLDEDDRLLFENLDDQFRSEMSRHNLKLYRCIYNDLIPFDEDKIYIHSNLNTGFDSMFKSLSKYLFCCFRFNKNVLTDNCSYISYWIVNSPDGIEGVIGDDCSMFDIEEIKYSDIDFFLSSFKKCDTDLVLSEVYIR